MTQPCSAYGCERPSARRSYSPLCPYHRSIQTRHGHPDQSGVTVHELKPYRQMVANRRKANPDSSAWRTLEGRWDRIVAHAQTTLDAWEAGRPGNRHAVQAADHVRTLAGTVPPSAVVETALAMVLMLRQRPHRFRSDKAFDHQLVRRVRGLSRVNAGSYWNDKTKKVCRVYRDLPPRTTQALASHLKAAFGVAGMHLSELEARSVDAGREEARQLQQAFAAMS